MLKSVLLLSLFFTHASWALEYYLKPKAYLDIETGKMIFDKLIKIKDDKISSIESHDKQNPKDIISMPDIFLVPGFINCHSHLLMTQTKEDLSFERALEREIGLDDNFRMTRALVFLKDYLKSGFTSLCDLGNSGYFLDSRLKELVANKAIYPMLYISGPGLATKKAQFTARSNVENVLKEYTLLEESSDLDAVLNNYKKKNIDILKIYLDNSPGSGSMSETLLSLILKNKNISFFKKITFHATTPESIELAKKFKLKHVEHLYNVNANENNLDSFTFVTPTDLDRETLKMFNYYQKAFFDLQLKRLEKLSRSKAKVVFGSDLYFHKENALFDRGAYSIKSILNYKEAGFSSLEILRALTMNPASSLGESKKIGHIKLNNFANFVGFKKNPLENILVLLEKPLVINRGVILK